MGIRSARGLYAIIDPEHCRGRDPTTVARAILEGGCAVMQLRAKRMDDGPRLGLARHLAALCRRAEVPFVVNDRPDLALLAGADGLHLGQGDLPLAEARRIVGDLPIGLSTHDEDQARSAVERGADAIGFGPVFETKSKENADPVVGLERLAAVCAASPLPVIAIGGITAARAASATTAGASLVAAISALSMADDPCPVAEALHRAARGGT